MLANKHVPPALTWPLPGRGGAGPWAVEGRPDSSQLVSLWLSFRAEAATESENKEEEVARQQPPMLASETAVAWPGLTSGLGLCKVENCLSPKMLIWP